jgi:rubrerythrin
MAIYSLDELLQMILQWERHLLYFYLDLADYLKDARARRVAGVLLEEQEKVLHMLEAIDINDYKQVEFIKNAPDFHSETVIPRLEIPAEASALEVLGTGLHFEEKLEEYYLHLRDIVVYTKSKELLEMLIPFKMGQIKRIKSFMDNYDLAV